LLFFSFKQRFFVWRPLLRGWLAFEWCIGAACCAQRYQLSAMDSLERHSSEESAAARTFRSGVSAVGNLAAALWKVGGQLRRVYGQATPDERRQADAAATRWRLGLFCGCVVVALWRETPHFDRTVRAKWPAFLAAAPH
jgi:hypothetical protein